MSELDGTLGIDVPTIIYRCLRTPLGAAEADVNPPVSLYHAFAEIKKTLSLLVNKHKLDIVLCFDNKPHPLKANTCDARRALRDSNLAALRDLYLYNESNDAIREQIAKKRQQLASPHGCNNLIAMLIDFCHKKIN